MKWIVETLSPDMNFGDLKGQTPLHVAAHVGDQDLAEYLITKGARIDVIDENSLSPVHICLQEDNLPLMQLFLAHRTETMQKPFFSSLLIMGIGMKAKQSINYLLDQQIASVFDTVDQTLTAMHAAAVSDDEEMVKLITRYFYKKENFFFFLNLKKEKKIFFYEIQ